MNDSFSEKNVSKLIITSYHSKQNHTKANPQTRPTARLVMVDTRLGWKTSRNTAPSGKHNNIQNTKFT